MDRVFTSRDTAAGLARAPPAEIRYHQSEASQHGLDIHLTDA